MEEVEATHTRANKDSEVYAESDDLQFLKNARIQGTQWIDVPLEQTRITAKEFFQLFTLAVFTHQEYILACGERGKLSETILSLLRTLQRLLQGKQLDSTLSDPKIVSRLEMVMSSSHSTLRAMDTVLTRYIIANRILWRSVKLMNRELVSVEELGRRLAANTEEFTMIAGTVGNIIG